MKVPHVCDQLLRHVSPSLAQITVYHLVAVFSNLVDVLRPTLQISTKMSTLIYVNKLTLFTHCCEFKVTLGAGVGGNFQLGFAVRVLDALQTSCIRGHFDDLHAVLGL